jgi:hypothetical protein
MSQRVFRQWILSIFLRLHLVSTLFSFLPLTPEEGFYNLGDL